MHPSDLIPRTDLPGRRRHASPARVATIAFAGPAGPPALRAATNVALLGGAGLLAASGLIHLYLWADGYRQIATIGALFLAQGIVGLVLAVLLVAFPRVTAAAAGIGYLLATVAAFALSASGGFLGFHDTLDAPWAANALVVDIGGLVCLIVGASLPLRSRERS